MAISVSFNGARFVEPRVATSAQVAPPNSFNIIPGGIIALIGEAEAGAPGSTDDIRENAYTPDQYSQIVSKYKSGPLVDAALTAFNPSNSEFVLQGANQIFIYKTNASTQSSKSLSKGAVDTYSTLTSKNYGLPENTISEQVETVQDEDPWTVTFNHIPDGNTATLFGARVNGGAADNYTIAANTTPAAFVTAVNAASTGIEGLQWSGGDARGVVDTTVASTLSLAVGSNTRVITLSLSSGSWDANPSVGDTLYIPSGSTVVGGEGNANRGGYLVTAVTDSTITALKLADMATAASAVAGPVARLNAFECYSPVTVTYGYAVLDGTGDTVSTTKSGDDVTYTTGGTFSDILGVGTWVKIDCSGASPFTSPNQGIFRVKSATSTTFVVENASGVASESYVINSISDITVYQSTPDGRGATVELYNNGTSSNVSPLEAFYGGTDRGAVDSNRVIDGSKLSVTFNADIGTFVCNTSFVGNAVEAGDILWVRPDSILKGGSYENVGAYLVTSADAQTIVAQKITDPSTHTNVSATDIAATTDLVVFAGIWSTGSVPLVNESGSERKARVLLSRASDSVSEESDILGGNVALEVGADDTTCTVTVDSANFSISAATLADLTLKLTDFATISDMADYINSQTGYYANVLLPVYGALPPSALDRVSAAPCATENPDIPGLRIKADSYDVQSFFDGSQLVDQTRASQGYIGLPFDQALPVFLTGASKGGTTQASISAALDELEKVQLNFVVPLFSRDAIKDIQDNLTDVTSNYQILAVHAAARAHVVKMSAPKVGKERQAFLSVKDTFVKSKTAVAALNNFRCNMSFQDPLIFKANGSLDWVQPWGLAVVAAGLQAGAVVGEPITNKYVLVSGIRHQDYDYEKDKEEALLAGLLAFDSPQTTGGVRCVLGNTCYLNDDNFAYNRISVIYAADTYLFNLRTRLQNRIGRSIAVVNKKTIETDIQTFNSSALAAGLIVGDDTNKGLGYKALVVALNGNLVTFSESITVVQGIDWIFGDTTIDTIRQTA